MKEIDLPLGYEESLHVQLEEFEKEIGETDTEGYIHGKTISNNRKVFLREDYRLENIRSTVLIPEKYLQYFQKRVKECKGVRNYINRLLFQYKLHISCGLVPEYSNLTTKYQEKDQNLQKISFRPFAEDWAELKLYRISFGMSISAFLVYLVIADSVDFVKAVSKLLLDSGVPTFPNYHYVVKVILSSNKDYYAVVFQFREERNKSDTRKNIPH